MVVPIKPFPPAPPRPVAMTGDDKLALALVRINAVLAACERLGVVVTVEQKPLLPLAMGNYKTVASVRLARERSQ